jgi:hypothetical protein
MLLQYRQHQDPTPNQTLNDQVVPQRPTIVENAMGASRGVVEQFGESPHEGVAFSYVREPIFGFRENQLAQMVQQHSETGLLCELIRNLLPSKSASIHQAILVMGQRCDR